MKLFQLVEEIKERIAKAKNLAELREIEIEILGRKGKISLFLKDLKKIKTLEERRRKGKEINEAKFFLTKLIRKKEEILARQLEEEILKKEEIDISQPGIKPRKGHLHLITKTIWQIEGIFKKMGFAVADGPEIETPYYNFDALNIPENHPARDLWDTFWLKKKNYLLRTHTSPVQIRYTEKNNPPLRIIAPGKVFRYEATDASHEIQFHQIEGLMVDKKVSLGNFKAIIKEFFNEFFSEETDIRFRPSYFPFTEPSVEIDIKPKKTDKWLEIMGAGMVHPKVLANVKINPLEWTGFAFGAGIERLIMIKYNIPDIRLFYKGDLRFIRQF